MQDPSALVRHEEARFGGAGGVSLYSQSWLPGGEARAALVIVHGLKDHSARYADAASALAGRGVAVFAADLRGHGQSAGDRQYVDSFGDYLADLEIYLGRVRAAAPEKPLFLLGHSMGGAIAALHCLRKAPALRGLILSAAALDSGVNGITEFFTKLVGALLPRLPVFSLDEDKFCRDPANAAAMKADPLIVHKNAPARTAAELLGAIAAIRAGAETLSPALLALHGTADTITVPAGSEELVRRAGSSDKALKMYDGLWHDLLHEPERAQVLADVTAFIEARL